MKDILIVDGYNVIFAWPELKTLGNESLEHARMRLKDYLQNYGCHHGFFVILVFDGKYVSDGASEEYITPDFLQVFTADGVTADAYIERAVFERKNRFTNIYVVTSDGAEQHQILGSGGLRIPVRELRRNIERAKTEERTYYKREHSEGLKRNEVAHMLDQEVARKLEEIRLGRKK